MIDYLKYFFRVLADDSIDSMSSSLAYAFMLSIFPFLIGIFALLHLLQQSVDIIEWTLNTFGDVLHSDIREFIDSSFRGMSVGRTGSILVISLLASIGFGSYGFKMIFIHLSKIFRDERRRPFVWRSLFAVIFAAGAMVVIVVSFVSIVTTEGVIRTISGRLEMSRFVSALINVLRFPFVLLWLVITSAVVYRIGPRRRIPLSCTLLSSLVFSCGWITATYFFGVYISRSGKFNFIYGALAGVMMFLVWMYISAFIFLAAAEIGKIRMEHLEQSKSGAEKNPRGGETSEGAGDSAPDGEQNPLS